MEELLQTLLKNEVLTEDVKTELDDAFKEVISEAKEQAQSDARAEMAKKFVAEKAILVEALDTKVEEFLKEELKELKEDIDNFRDLEVEYNQKLLNEKKKMAKVVEGDMQTLVEAIDAFLELRLDSEFEELSESIDEVRKNQLGNQIFEMFSNVYTRNFTDEAQTQKQLAEAKEELRATQKRLKNEHKSLKEAKRANKLQEVLVDLSGDNREVMESILSTVPTEKLEESYEKYISKVLHNSVKNTVDSRKEEQSVLAESKEEDESTLMVRDGNSADTSRKKDVTTESESDSKLTEAYKSSLKKLAGIE